MGMIDTIRTYLGLPQGERSITYPPMGGGVDNWMPWLNFGGNQYSLNGLTETLKGDREELDAGSFTSLVQYAYKSNGVVFACMLTRLMLFSQARFTYQRLRGGRPDELWGDESLLILERPWPNAGTSDLLARAITDVDTAGNFYATLRNGQIRRLRPDWVAIILGSDGDDDVIAGDIDAEVLGYVYYPGGKWSGREPEYLQRGQVAHFTLVPDPLASFRGMSWLTPIIREIMGDSAATSHKLKFFENGATPNMVVKFDITDAEKFKRAVEMSEAQYAGLSNAYKTFYIAGGADATVVGSNFEQMSFKTVQGAGETRIAAAARVHPAIVGLSEGLQGASLNAGNFAAARRLVADGFLHPAWGNFAGSMQTIVPAPRGSRLWTDTRDIPFLREDRKDAAEIERIKGATIGQYVRDGFVAESAVAAVEAEDTSLLEHSGRFSVQLLPPGTEKSEPTIEVEPASPKPANGKPAAKPAAGANT
jgi:phage portal protein BeeE